MRGYEEKPMMGLGCYVGDLVEGPRQPGICSRLSGIIESRGQPWPGRAPLVRASSQFTKVVGAIPGQGTHKNQTVMKQKAEDSSVTGYFVGGAVTLFLSVLR